MSVIQSIKNSFSIYNQPKVIAILFLGFSSGLPLALTASTLSAWLAESGINKSTIGLFAAVSTPYALKFLWAPLIDGLRFPILCRLLGFRRGWLVAMQLAVAFSLMLLGLADPSISPWVTASAALLVAICSASQDIIIDAYRVEILKPEQYGAGAANAVLGYRIGMIVSSAGALYLATYIGWLGTYWVMATLMGIGITAALITGEPDVVHDVKPVHELGMRGWISQFVLAPLKEFMGRDHWFAILLFIVLYKLADAFIGIMTNPFLLEIGFEKTQIAEVVKLYGIGATILGSFIGGWLVQRIGMVRSLWICGIGHALTNLMFVVQARVGADIGILILGISLENITGGMGLAAFVAFMSSLCNVHFTATQYALLSSLSAFGRTWLSMPAGWVAEKLGWEGFFLFATALAIPGLVVLAWLGKRLKASAPPAEAT